MAEGVLFNVAARIIGRLGSLAFQEIGLIWGVQDELHKLQEIVAGFQGVLLDAEQKQTNNEVKVWLESVEDVVYEADDLLDEFNTEAQQRQMMCGNTKMAKKVHLFFSSSNQLAFGLKMSYKIKDINKRLREVASRRAFPLEVNHEDTRFIIRERITHSFVRKENIIGRDEDKKAIIQLLLDPISTENVSTISIVGFGGLGKTALAQLIFNDEVIQNHFELKIWSCISNVFELDILVKKILKVDKIDMDERQNDLRRKVDGKKYLIVLDDVWNENREKWLSLKYLLMGGEKGSRILITTRSETVATISDTAKPYSLRGLNQEDSRSLFKEMAFKDGKESENSTIKAIGKEVARKCQGVPLAIRTIGGMLHTKYHETEWLNFKENKLPRIYQEENEILPTLKLSYDVLPSHLKHCFAYCSLFPPDYEISVPMLIRLWVAQGFIKSFGENKSLEDVACEYYMELLCRSFFQEEEKDEFGIIKSCKMHDLLNELAILVSGVESTVVDRNQKKFHEKLRHVSFNFHVDPLKWEVPTSLLKAKKIRTLLLPCPWYKSRRYNSFCATIISNFKSLRMLSLNGFGITKLPNCLKKVKHLRYLDLTRNSIERLPDWIVGLSNLETLDLTACKYLVELPRDIKKMINLRHLILEGCWKLTRMPRGLGELTGLRTLDKFVLSKNNSLLRDSAGLGELGKLRELRGELEIINLRQEKDVMSDSNVGTPLKEKQHLHSLTLKWKRGEDVNAVDEKDIIMSMEVLQPHSNLKKLSVWRYGGVRFASWFSSLINLVHLTLWGCHRCQHLPPLDHFPSLKFLKLEEFEKLEYISDTSSSNSMSDEMMTSLECLWVVNCPVLKGWWRAHTHNNASSSSSTENLSLPSFPGLSTLWISNCPNLTCMPLYPNVERIDLNGCSSKVVDSLFVRGASDITHDVGVDVSASSSSPHLSKLTYLSLFGIEDLAVLQSLQSPCIKDFPHLALLPYHGMGNLTSLQKLTIGDYSDLTLPPDVVINLPSLQSLTILSFPNLVSLPEEISNLTSLQHLAIESCPNLASLPEGICRLPNLNRLQIWGCNMLSERCKKEIGDDWPKIAHIPHITF
ncbi:putative disease resistance protein RGA3 [Malus sylvestris]|uniref:putative disease resistance protein RGA3 n=1 Tax=Malus sylvestris TaxID=3752 RepID=UPI0021AD1581|nr:putative disease resistance protein RGA3 [Malus sylvestris]XP_050139645.1 putative disease resistance protein RGA3 [Malus sylvestris]XP_050139646.1 putative disease resistance protein RGA3 [Malus sylvestris]XP_050139647.1 putative disease resistance protein RGA3 [Malus sylvestris]XP_050139648.1 putative disease resistance protein RGA3 [Malus sylvestris]XP_050139649.1 putative disease resistance protein RGA3 [Malus sylvestris]XP_050139650.1 putative disease resistance protein RGA3 [Malus sy